MNSSAPVYQSADVLYADTDFSKLNWVETQWAAWYLWIGNPVIATGLMSFLLHEVCSASGSRMPCPYLVPSDRLFRPLYPVDHHRLHSVLPAVEAPG